MVFLEMLENICVKMNDIVFQKGSFVLLKGVYDTPLVQVHVYAVSFLSQVTCMKEKTFEKIHEKNALLGLKNCVTCPMESRSGNVLQYSSL